MKSYVVAQLLVLGARAGQDPPKGSLLEQADRLNKKVDRIQEKLLVQVAKQR